MPSALITLYTTDYGAGAGTAFSCFMVADHGPQNTPKHRSSHHTFGGFSAHIHRSRVVFTVAEIIVLGVHINALGINNNLLRRTIATIAIGASTGDYNYKSQTQQ